MPKPTPIKATLETLTINQAHFRTESGDVVILNSHPRLSRAGDTGTIENGVFIPDNATNQALHRRNQLAAKGRSFQDDHG